MIVGARGVFLNNISLFMKKEKQIGNLCVMHEALFQLNILVFRLIITVFYKLCNKGISFQLATKESY